MRAPIARIRISAGNPGWYDPLTNIHLTITRPESLVYEGSNLTNLKIGIAHKLIHVVEGDLDLNDKQVQSNPIVVEEEVREVIKEPAKEKQPIIKEETKEEVKEKEVVEEVKEEKKAAKKTTTKKKTSTKKVEETTK